MSKTATLRQNRISKQFVVLDRSTRFCKQLGEQQSTQVSRISDVSEVVKKSSDTTLWIVITSSLMDSLLEAVSSHAFQQQKSMSFGDLLMFTPPTRPELLASLHSQFRRVVGEVPKFRFLPPDQLAEVLSSTNGVDLFIGGIVDQVSGTITLARGDLTTVTVPLSIFSTEGPCSPDFAHFELDDYGYTLRFGDYEASAHSVLFRIDPGYRRRANRQRIAEERGFGPSLRRLRILRHLSRKDFPGISSKTIARIERGETEKPHGKTLETLAKVLGVAPAEIETY